MKYRVVVEVEWDGVPDTIFKVPCSFVCDPRPAPFQVTMIACAFLMGAMLRENEKLGFDRERALEFLCEQAGKFRLVD